MKLNYAFLFLFFLGMNTSIWATTFRVNNTPNTDADFDNLIDAHAIARDGDTLLIEGGADSYGDFTMTKRLTLIGPGYFLDENSDNVISNPAKINSITLDPTSTNNPSTGAAGSKLIGLDFGFSSVFSTVRINVNDVVVQKCRTFRIGILNDTRNSVPAVGIQVIQNYILSGVVANSGATGPIVNVQIANNIFTSGLSLPDNSSGAILHNLVDDGRATLQGFVGEIRSNIFTNTGDFVLPVLPNQQISHNIAANGQLGNDNNNFTTVVDNLFVEEADNSTDGKWQLKPNSLAVNRAHDGTDIGPYGGTIPYVLSGQGSNPAIIFFEVEPVGTASNRLKVRIRAKSSN